VLKVETIALQINILAKLVEVSYVVWFPCIPDISKYEVRERS